MLVFTHIPRTGGTSLRAFIAEKMRKPKFIDAFTDFAFMKDDELNAHDFLATHCGFGIFNRIKRDINKIIILRNPIERIVSHYYYLRNLPKYVSYSSHYAKTMSLDAFVMETNPAVSIAVEDTQTWHLIEDKNLTFRQRHSVLSDAEKVETALRNLQMYEFIGFADRLDNLVDRLCSAYGWERSALPWLARSDKPTLTALEPSVILKIESKVSLDLRLYEEAKDRFG